ncbi:MAG: hypothetical protein KJ893_03060 [Candidatus Omnitrophica bacterium]|nr:hypothetical protein [Candidatus Omnitrophota bacterium]MBU4479758.1 hypothetical protein [Candidatus Omnitrophota bacterium]MCG2703281.1 hypothetical protein [Candidatus Omnitrophota bacterium]
MDKEIIYNKAKALKETIEKIKGSDIKNEMIVNSCNILIQEAKAIDNLTDLQEVCWDKNTKSAAKAEIDFNLGQILAVLRKKDGCSIDFA